MSIDGARQSRGARRHESVIVRLAVVSALVGLLALVGFLVWLAASDFSEAGSEAKVLAAALALIGVLITQAIALVGLFVKRSFDERTLSLSKAAEDRLRSEGDRNNVLQQADRNMNRVKTVGELFKYLASTDDREREAALVLIGELGDAELALRLSAIYKAEGGIGAIARLTQSTDPETSLEANLALRGVIEGLRTSVVRVRFEAEGKEFSATGFCAGSTDRIVTLWHDPRELGPIRVEFNTSDNPEHAPTVTVATLMDMIHTPTRWGELSVLGLRVDKGLGLQPLKFSATGGLRPGDPLCSLSYAAGMGPAGAIGIFTGRSNDDLLSISGFGSTPGSAGAPVVDRSGNLVGMYFLADASGGRYALGVEQFSELLEPR